MRAFRRGRYGHALNNAHPGMRAGRPGPTSPEQGLGVPSGIVGVAAETLRGTWLPGLPTTS